MKEGSSPKKTVKGIIHYTGERTGAGSGRRQEERGSRAGGITDSELRECWIRLDGCSGEAGSHPRPREVESLSPGELSHVLTKGGQEGAGGRRVMRFISGQAGSASPIGSPERGFFHKHMEIQA